MQPVPPPRRIPSLDALRGVALLGIVIANMRGFGLPMEAYSQPALVWDAPTDRAVQAAVDFFVTGKFLALFAMLFGVGFAIQRDRAEERGQPFGPLYARRMAGLLLFGTAHVLLLWWGDILLIYAVAGLLLLVLRDAFEDGPVRWAVMLYSMPVFFFACFVLLAAVGGSPVEAPPEAPAQTMWQAAEVYLNGSFSETVAQRVEDWVHFNQGGFLVVARVLGLYLFGYWVWSTRALTAASVLRQGLRPWWPALLAAGVAGNLLYVAIVHLWSGDLMQPTWLNTLAWIANAIGTPALALVYAGAVLLCFGTERGRRLFTPFTCVGRMALSNYLAQSLIGAWIFHGWGLGRFGELGPLPCVGLAIGIYTAQVILSALWLHHFRYGPLEWLWRRMTYWPA